MASGISLRPPHKTEYCLSAATNVTDNFSSFYDNHLIMGGFNLEPQNPHMDNFLNSDSLPI